MSYRTYINGRQVFGNNDAFPEWIDFVKSQGIHVDPELRYEGDLYDFGEALSVTESIVLRLDADIARRRRDFEASLLDPSSAAAKKHLLSYPDGLFDLEAMRARAMDYRDDPRTGEALLDGLRELQETGYLFLPLRLYNACAELLEPLSPDETYRTCGFRLKPGNKIRIRAA